MGVEHEVFVTRRIWEDRVTEGTNLSETRIVVSGVEEAVFFNAQNKMHNIISDGFDCLKSLIRGVLMLDI